ncbi:hypothetical protein BC628DRAFT_1313978 [Trametes gibbosa]|nr:hypothetical protein BC628DRAFT_1313978 [Trametes gibbosa]UVI59129.1 Zn(2)-Cys(6)29 [Trametes gibbosa]
MQAGPSTDRVALAQGASDTDGQPAENEPRNGRDQLQETTGKVKRTRRRQRLNCVECTRKRTKCDRQIPCSTCVSRGIPQLCRWEPMVVRPAPQAPPEGALSGSTIAALSSRIAVLEQTLLRQNLQHERSADCTAGAQPPISSVLESATTVSPSETPAVSGTTISPNTQTQRVSTPHTAQLVENSTVSTDSPHDSTASNSGECALSLFDHDLQRAAIAMAQMSLAPRDEYVGGGTVLCALHRLGDTALFRFPVARSSDSTTFDPPDLQPGGHHPLTSQIQRMLSDLPPRENIDELINGFFAERNWEFALPERWFRHSCEEMWRHLELKCANYAACIVSGGCERCTKELNPHWLSLFFAVLALAPRRFVGANAKSYFLKAMEARRLIEDMILAARAYPHSCSASGVVQSSLAAALLAKYFADQGQVSDAWKLAGTALRTAQAAGLHRDPGWRKWDHMDRQERELRLVAWWSLVVADRLYSFILGRPMMTLPGTFDVKLLPGATHGDGSPNPFFDFQRCLITLFDIIGETLDKCLGICAPTYATVLEMDGKYKLWLSKLPLSLDWRRTHSPPSTPQKRNIAYQRHMCAAFYLAALMNLHRPYLMHAPPILAQSTTLSPTMKVILNPSRERCIETALELVRVVCVCKDEAAGWEPLLPATLFHYTYFVFDGAVALMGALSQDPPHSKAQEGLELIDRATSMLRGCVATLTGMTQIGGQVEGEGDMARRAILVLEALRKAGRWDERFQRGAYTLGTEGNAQTRSSYVAQEPITQGAQAPYNMKSYPPWERVIPATEAPTSGLTGTRNTEPLLASAASSPAFTPFSSTAPRPPPSVSSTSSQPPPAQAQSQPSAPAPDSMFVTALPNFSSSPAAPVQLQTMPMPFDMLQRDARGAEGYAIDWSMFSEIQGWPGNGLFGG